MIWVGLVFFVNFVQLVVLRTADEPARGFLHKAVVPSVAWWFRHASTVAVASGVLLLVLAGYLLPSLVYGTGVYVPPARALLLWGGVIGALAMWMFVHMYIWPSMQVVLGLRPGDDAAKARPGPRRHSSPGSISCCRCPSCSPWWRRRTSTDVADAATGQRPGDGDAVVASARAGEPDRYLAALLAPPPRAPTCWRWRPSRASWRACPSLVTREPAMGEIRLQWWRDALAASGASCAHRQSRSPTPCAPPCTATICRARSCSTRSTRARWTSPGEPMPDDAALATYLWKSEGALFALAAGILRREPGADVQAAAVACGQAYGLARLLLGLPQALSRGRAAAAAIAPGCLRA